MTGSAKQSIVPHKEEKKNGLLRRFAPRNDVETHARAFRDANRARVMPKTSAPLRSEGAGNAGRSDSARSLVCEIKKHTSIVTTVTPDSPGIPYAMVYGLYRALPGDRAFLPPSPAKIDSANLTPASGRQDHTTLPYAGSAPSSEALPASTASRPAFVTIASRPSSGTGRGEIYP
jgi:hypothetical protein